jgi:hypothetical protein
MAEVSRRDLRAVIQKKTKMFSYLGHALCAGESLHKSHFGYFYLSTVAHLYAGFVW